MIPVIFVCQLILQHMVFRGMESECMESECMILILIFNSEEWLGVVDTACYAKSRKLTRFLSEVPKKKKAN